MSEVTEDRFETHIPHLARALAAYRDRPNVRMLEIGDGAGRSTVWFLDTILTGEGSHLTLVATGATGADPIVRPLTRERLRRELKRYVDGNRLTVAAGQSRPFLAAAVANRAPADPGGYHLAALGGAHAAPDVLADAVLAWALLAPGGIMIFNDYFWDEAPTEQERPRFAIDSFLACYLGRYDELHRGDQVIIRRRDAETDTAILNGRSEQEPEHLLQTVTGQAASEPPSRPQRRRRGKRGRR